MTRSETLAETVHVLRDRAPSGPSSGQPFGQPKPVGRRVVAGVVAVATMLGFLTASALPVRAGNDDLVKALAAIAVIGLIARAAEAHDKDHDTPKPQPGKTVPGSCGLKLPGSPIPVFSERCILQSGFKGALPVACARPAQLYGKPDRVYSVPCLNRAGIQIATRR